MKFLLSNDDGYFAPGLAALAAHLATLGEVTVVAPERDRSGASNSLTLDRPLSVRRAPNGFLFVNGTPSDCVHLALTGLMDSPPDMVISGINHGANMGDDTIYSGTVAAATEGFLLGIPALAVSLASRQPRYFDTACLAVSRLLQQLPHRTETGPQLLNMNVPDVPPEQLGELTATRLGRRHHAEPVIRSQNPKGETIYWVGPPGQAQDADLGTDFHAIANGQVSITPLMIDLTAHRQLAGVASWLTS